MRMILLTIILMILGLAVRSNNGGPRGSAAYVILMALNTTSMAAVLSSYLLDLRYGRITPAKKSLETTSVLHKQSMWVMHCRAVITFPSYAAFLYITPNSRFLGSGFSLRFSSTSLTNFVSCYSNLEWQAQFTKPNAVFKTGITRRLK